MGAADQVRAGRDELGWPQRETVCPECGQVDVETWDGPVDGSHAYGWSLRVHRNPECSVSRRVAEEVAAFLRQLVDRTVRPPGD